MNRSGLNLANLPGVTLASKSLAAMAAGVVIAMGALTVRMGALTVRGCARAQTLS